MLRVLLPDIFHSKIVDDKGETDGTGVMRPETWHRFALAVAMRCKPLFAVYPLLYFTVDVAVGGGLVSEIVMWDDVVGHVGDMQAHVFEPGHRGV